MPDDPNRDDNEAKLQLILAGLLIDLEQAALARLGDRPMMDDLPSWFYAQAKQMIKREVSPVLKDTAFAAALRTGDSLNWDINALWVASEINKRIDAQAELVAESILSKLQTQVGDRIRQVRAGELALGAYLYSLWGERYPESVSITETTRAISAGENATTADIERELSQLRRKRGEVADVADGRIVDSEDTTGAVERKPGEQKPPDRRTPSSERLNLIKIWRTQQDERVCPICSPLNGTNQRVWGAKYPSGPPSHPNCVLAETPVSGASLVSALHVHYQGPVVRVHLSDGSSFAVTPNHMLLSPLGFVRATDLVEGDYLLHAAPVDKALTDPDNKWKPPTAEEVVRSLSVSSGVQSSSVPVSPEYLHGDAAFGHGDINIVRPDSLLGRELNPGVTEPTHYSHFVFGRDPSGLFTANSSLAQISMRLGTTTDGGMSSRRESKSLRLGELRHANEISLRTRADLQPNLAKPFCDCATADAEFFAHMQDAFPTMISSRQVVKVDKYTLHNPILVYDFQTLETIYYIGNGVISSNCRCFLIYHIGGAGL